MSIIGNRYTLVDAAKRLDSNGVYTEICEVLQKSNPILDDIPFFESNAPRGNRVTFRTGLPQVQWGSLNKGTPTGRSDVTSRVDTIGLLEGRSEVDRRHKGLSMNPAAYAAFRWDEDQTFLESMSQKMAETVINGSELTEPSAFTGFLPRLSDVNDSLFGGSITKAATRQASHVYENILIVDWGKRYCHGLYPMGTPGGLQKENHENEKVLDRDGNAFYADVSTFEWSMGLTVKDPRHVHAIRNIDRAALEGIESDEAARPSGVEDIVGLMIRAINQMKPCNDGQRVIYCSKGMLTALELLARTQPRLMISYAEWDGRPVTTFRGNPIKALDYLDTLEDAGI
ncbi:MAG: hypothetical protein MJ058_04125 [Akkermansia sp.]|nr:hypothetical protein [Akkermansia sp.]